MENVEDPNNLTRKDFLLSPETGIIREKVEEYQFSDYETDSGDSNDEFEESRESVTDTEDQPASEHFLTPVNLKSTFARNLQAKSTVKPASCPPPKRPAPSPANKKVGKKLRANPASKIPKKK